MKLREFTETPIVTVNRQLNPKLWDNGKLAPEIAAKLTEIAAAFEEFVGIELDVIDRIVTGSNANYNWTEYSDLDLHLIIPGVPTDEQRELFNAKKALWAEQHDIKIRGLPVECYVQGAKEPHHSTGIYSVDQAKWLVVPKKIKPSIDDAAFKAKKDSVIHDVEAVLLSADLEGLRKVKDKISTMRRAGLARAGEWSTENLVFKHLRSLGFIEQISDKIRALEDQELSLEQSVPSLD